MVGVVAYKMFPMIVTCKKEVCRETIVDQLDMDIGKVANAVIQTEYMCKQLSAKIRSVSFIKI